MKFKVIVKMVSDKNLKKKIELRRKLEGLSKPNSKPARGRIVAVQIENVKVQSKKPKIPNTLKLYDMIDYAVKLFIFGSFFLVFLVITVMSFPTGILLFGFPLIVSIYFLRKILCSPMTKVTGATNDMGLMPSLRSGLYGNSSYFGREGCANCGKQKSSWKRKSGKFCSLFCEKQWRGKSSQRRMMNKMVVPNEAEARGQLFPDDDKDDVYEDWTEWESDEEYV